MNISTRTGLMCLMLVLGIAIGVGVTLFLSARFVSSASTTSQISEVTLTIRTLQRLRSDDVHGAVDLLESRLDGSLISLDSSLSAVPSSRSDPKSVQALRLAQEYRRKYPRKTAIPQVDSAVERALSTIELKGPS